MFPPDSTHRSLRSALGQFATGIAVVTACDADGHLVGLTVNSFASVSLEPPLVLWSLNAQSSLIDTFERCSHYAINVLAADQIELSRLFAGSKANKFSGLEWKVGAGGTALLSGCCASFECRNETRHAGGDHVIFVGQIENHHRSKETLSPLLYHAGHYRHLTA